jgi:hypothetical protein
MIAVREKTARARIRWFTGVQGLFYLTENLIFDSIVVNDISVTIVIRTEIDFEVAIPSLFGKPSYPAIPLEPLRREQTLRKIEPSGVGRVNRTLVSDFFDFPRDHHIHSDLGIGDIGQVCRGDACADSGNFSPLNDRGDEEADFVNEFCFEGSTQGLPAALDEDAGDASFTEFLQDFP